MTESEIFHIQGRVSWTGRIPIRVVADFIEAAFVSWIIGDKYLLKMEVILKESISVNGIKSRITNEGIRIKVWM